MDDFFCKAINLYTSKQCRCWNDVEKWICDFNTATKGINKTTSLVGGFNPFEKYQSKWESSPNRDEHKKYLKPPPSSSFGEIIEAFWSHPPRLRRSWIPPNGAKMACLKMSKTYCWWLKSGEKTTWDGAETLQIILNNGINYLSLNWWTPDFSHQQYWFMGL